MKVCFLGAGSTIFVKNIIGDMMLTKSLAESHVALYDIDKQRLNDSRLLLENLNATINKNRMKITNHLGTQSRKTALKNADFVITAVQIGGYKPATVTDFEIPKKYGLKQTIADTLGIGGIFRGLRTIHAFESFAKDMEQVCPNSLLLNYVNPMCMVTGYMLLHTPIKTVGLCHSVQVCVPHLFDNLKIKIPAKETEWEIAGINHMAWLLKIRHKGRDLYPEIKKKAAKLIRDAVKPGAQKNEDMVRLEMMKHFGYYITESSEHNAEYTPYWIKSNYPELIEKYNIPIDEYIRRCEDQIKDWNSQRENIINNEEIKHKRSHEYGAYIMEAITTDKPIRIHGNVLNNGLITNLPTTATVEVPCLVNRNGIQPTIVGKLPEQCAALNRTNINVQLLTIAAAAEHNRDRVYQAAYLDPHTSAELSLDDIKKMCDELFKAHQQFLPKYK